MSLVTTKTPIFDDIPSIQFFNGRLLTGDDMSTEQESNAARRRLLGQALGSGVAFGLAVAKPDASRSDYAGLPVVTVQAGLAINGDGELLHLTQSTDVSLAHIDATTAPPADFVTCSPTQYSAYVKSDGVYLLAVCPASGTQGRAQVMGLANQQSSCNRKYRREGVQFRLHQLKLSVDELADRDKLRNLVAYKCFASESGQPFVVDPFGALGSAGILLDGALVPALDSSEVPLATVFWTTDNGVEYADMWSVRRNPLPLPGSLNAARSNLRGGERMLQFVSQLDSLLATTGTVTGVRLSDRFRYVPPGFLLPVQAASSAGGFKAGEFLADYWRGTPTAASPGQCARLLRDSLSAEYVDLDAPARLELYAPTHAAGGAADSDGTRRYCLCVSRDVFGPAASDELAKIMEDAWDAYRGLAKRQVFLPPATDDAKIAARLSIVDAIRDVMAIASRYATLALGGSLDYGGGLKACQAMYALQNELTTLFATAIPGIDDTQEREVFAQVIDGYLNETLPGSRPALKAALSAGSLVGAIDAQIEINRFVGTWSGEGVAIGPFGFTYSESPGGTGLVPGAIALPQVFILSNGTNRTLTMALDASALADHGNWSASTKILGSIDGDPIDQATLASGASRMVVVMVAAPSDGKKDDPVTLTLTATVGPPTSRASPYTNSKLLTVAAAAGGPVAGQVLIATPFLSGSNSDQANIDPGKFVALRVPFAYSAADGIARDFTLTISATSSGASLDKWKLQNEDTGAVLSPTGGDFSVNVSGVPADNTPLTVKLRITAAPRNPASNNTLSLSFKTDSVSLTPPVSDKSKVPLVLVVKSTP